MKRSLIMLLVIVSLSCLFLISGFGQQKIVKTEDLPAVESIENLKVLLEEYIKTQRYTNYRGLESAVKIAEDAAVNMTVETATASKAESPSGDYATTNIQVQGVDEGDIVKSDGRYIYQMNENQILVVDTKRNGRMEIVSRINFDDANFYPEEMYVDESNLIVIGHSNVPIRLPKPIVYDNANQAVKDKKIEVSRLREPYGYPQNTVHIKVYDIENKQQIKERREISLEGHYVSSRKIKNHFYLVANNPIDHYRMEHIHEGIIPHYKDTLLGEAAQSIDLKDIKYFPGSVAPNYITIMGLDISRSNSKVNIYSYLGQGNNMYVSLENLYIAVDRFQANPQALVQSKNSEERFVPSYEHDTEVYKFQLNKGEVKYKAKGKVPGRILNQFAMDEYDGHFRIATTTGEMWRTDEFTSKNNVYILDGRLQEVGKLEGIAPTERIYAMRFMGERGYMVTFRETDPFFAIDLKNPQNPKILGKLKIPGYSDYLHPYDENHIIGFGKEVMESKGNALQAGMKIAMFDVRNVNHPVEKFKTVIGGRGTDSSLLRDHKALLFSKEKNLLAFPITVIEADESMPTAWGDFAFQGAYIYDLDLQKGFKLKGKITHLSEEDYQNSGNYWYDSDKNINRIIYIGDILYTLSNDQIKAHDIENVKLKDSIFLNH